MSLAIANTSANSTPIVTKKGRVVGQRFIFGQLSAKELREAGRKLGHKGAALNRYVNTALMDEAAQRRAAGAVFMSAAESQGMLPDTGELRKASGVLRFTGLKDVKDESTSREAELLAVIEKLRAELAAK